VGVAETGNISRAAQKLFLTQPALSRQIKALEEEIGQCLLERQAHSIRLTPAGETLLHEARALLQQAGQVVERVRGSGQGVRLRVGYAPSLASGLLSIAVEQFAQKHPTAHVELFDFSSNEMVTGLDKNELDVALTVGEERERGGVKWSALMKSPWQLAVNDRHELARRREATPEEVAREQLLVFCQRDYPEYWKMVMAWMKENKQRPTIAGEYDGVTSLLAAVEAGQGVALVTTCTANLIPRRVRMKPLSNGPEPVCIAAGYRANRAAEKPLAVFIEELRAAARALAQPG
jgi:DNA-binding transcriptional LysR family regulator